MALYTNVQRMTTGTTGLANSLQHQIMTEILQAEVWPAVMENATLLQLCKIYDIGSQPTLTVAQQMFGAITVSSITDGTAIDNAAHTMAETTISATGYGAMVTVTDKASSSTVSDIVSGFARELAIEVADELDAAVGALLDNFSNTVGTTNTTNTFSNMVGAATTLRINAKGQAKDGVFALYPTQIKNLQTQAVSTITEGMGSTALTEGRGVTPGPVLAMGVNDLYSAPLSNVVGTFMNMPVVSTVNVPTMNSAVDSGGALFVKNAAIGAAIKWLPKIEMVRSTVNGIAGWTIYCDALAGFGELRDVYGVTIVSVR